MKLNKTQLNIFLLISKGIGVKAKEMPSSLGISRPLVFLGIKRLHSLGLIEKTNKKITVSQKEFARILANLLNDDETLIDVLRDLGIPILSALIEAHTLMEIARQTKSSIPTIYPYIRKLVQRNIIKKEKKQYAFNKELWKELYQFILGYKENYLLNKFDIPNNAKIYFQSEEEIIFSLPIEYESATKTAFSLYAEYGVRLYEKEIYYRLPKSKDVEKETILLDSLKASKGSARKRLYCCLFYLKNKEKLKKIKVEELNIFKSIIKEDKKYPDYPTRREIIDKAEDYDIPI